MKLEENRAPDPKEESAAGDRQEIMEIAMRAGHILRENGAEISRVRKVDFYLFAVENLLEVIAHVYTEL